MMSVSLTPACEYAGTAKVARRDLHAVLAERVDVEQPPSPRR
jgi:hypothetical protein